MRLVTPPEGTLFYNIAAGALARAGRKFEIVCTSGNPDVLRSAVDAGYGVSLAPTHAGAQERAAAAGGAAGAAARRDARPLRARRRRRARRASRCWRT